MEEEILNNQNETIESDLVEVSNEQEVDETEEKRAALHARISSIGDKNLRAILLDFFDLTFGN